LPFVSEATVSGEVAPEAVCVVPPSLEAQVAVKAVMALPPLPFEVNATAAELLPPPTPLRVGAGGLEAATKELEAVDAALSATAFVATAVQVYVLALVSDPTVIGDDAPDADWVAPPSLEAQVTV